MCMHVSMLILTDQRPKLCSIAASALEDFLNVTFMVSSTALILQGALARAPESAPGAGWMRLHPLFMGLAFSLMISLGCLGSHACACVCVCHMVLGNSWGSWDHIFAIHVGQNHRWSRKLRLLDVQL